MRALRPSFPTENQGGKSVQRPKKPSRCSRLSRLCGERPWLIVCLKLGGRGGLGSRVESLDAGCRASESRPDYLLAGGGRGGAWGMGI